MTTMPPSSCRACNQPAIFKIRWGTDTQGRQEGVFCERCTSSLWDRVKHGVQSGWGIWIQEGVTDE